MLNPSLSMTSSLLDGHSGKNFSLVHVDSSLIVADKPTRLLSVPGRGPDKQDCLIHRIQAEFPDALIVHRLDYDTSGLIVLARGKAVHRALSILFQDRQVEKRYVAIIAGRLDPPNGEVDLPLIVDWPNRPLHKVDFTSGKPSLTRYQAIDYNPEEDFSRVILVPETGRTHQLRVHMKAIGHPILGDPLYADEQSKTKADRLLLHADYLSFVHPVTGETLRYSCDADF